MAIQNAIITIPNTTITVPKDTAVTFPYQITAPNYNGELITRNLEVVDKGVLGSGNYFEIDLYKDKFVNINEVNISLV